MIETPTPEAPRETLLALAKRLNEPTDRDSYADLVYWFRTLPPEDEMVKLARLLGFLTLIGNDLPVALEHSATTISGLVQTNESYHRALNERLTKLPAEIGAGIDVKAFAEMMAEGFRQQFATTGLEATADYLEELAPEFKGSVDALGVLAKATRAYGDTLQRGLDAILAKLNTAANSAERIIAMKTREVEKKNRNAIALAVLASVLFGLLGGFLTARWIEKQSTTTALVSLQGQMEQVQQSIQALKPVAPPPEKVKRH